MFNATNIFSCKKLSRGADLFASMSAKFGSSFNTLQKQYKQTITYIIILHKMKNSAALHGY